MDMELAAARALFAARMLERALHDRGAWTVRWRGVEVPAARSLCADGVSFAADFPEVCYLGEVDPMTLLCDGEVVGIRTPEHAEHPGDTGFLIRWEILAKTAVPA